MAASPDLRVPPLVTGENAHRPTGATPCPLFSSRAPPAEQADAVTGTRSDFARRMGFGEVLEPRRA